MSITLAEIIARSTEMALVGIDDPQSYLQTAEVLAETLYPQVVQAVSRDAAGDPLRVQQVQATHTLTFADGKADLPTNLLSEYLAQSTIDVESEPGWGPITAFMPWVDFRNGFDSRLGGYAVHPAGSLYFTPPNTPFVAGSGYGGDALLTAPSSPIQPSSATAAIEISPGVNMPQELEDPIITGIASAMKGNAAWLSLSSRLPMPGSTT